MQSVKAPCKSSDDIYQLIYAQEQHAPLSSCYQHRDRFNMVGPTYIGSDQRQQLLRRLSLCCVLQQHFKPIPFVSGTCQTWHSSTIFQMSAFLPSLPYCSTLQHMPFTASTSTHSQNIQDPSSMRSPLFLASGLTSTAANLKPSSNGTSNMALSSAWHPMSFPS